MRIFAFGALALLLVPGAAHALCRDEIKELTPRIERLKNTDPDRYGLANHWLALAVVAEPGSESECATYIIRARRALTQPSQQAAACKVADPDPAVCDKAGNPLPAFRPPGGQGGVAGVLPGGDGGPVGPAGGPPPFVPPGEH